MSPRPLGPHSTRAAIVLAAGGDEASRALLTHPLGDGCVAELALANVRSLVPADGLDWEAGPGPLPPLRASLVRVGEGAGLPIHDLLGALFGAALPEPRFCSVTRIGMSGSDARGRWLSPLDEVLETRREIWLQAHLQG